MENQKEKLRASNIIWNASGDYSFDPEMKAYDENGRADLYWNCIIGSVHKYYDYNLLESFLSSLKDNSNYDFYKSLTWIGLENCAYEKEKNERPILKSLRENYALKFLGELNETSDKDVLDEIRIAHFQKVLGEEPNLTGLSLNLLKDLEFDETMNMEQIINNMNEIMKVYFEFSPSNKKENMLKKIMKNRKMIHFGENKGRKAHGTPHQKRIDIGSAEYSGNFNFDEIKTVKKKITFQWLQYMERRDQEEREYIQSYFGTPILEEPETKALEQTLCTENHENCRLHFTRGEFDNTKESAHRKNVTSTQRVNNIQYFNDNLPRNNNSISKLTHKIQNTILVNQDSYNKAKNGKLVARMIWRNVYLHDDKIFTKKFQDEMGDLAVDILLDASASQIYRQEIIATQGYIIAESLTQCRIPVKVYSFCNMRNYTIINLFRNYGEVKKNDNIFNYNAAGYNRDGLAIRIAINMMQKSTCENNTSCPRQSTNVNKILIVLSDGKPNDMNGIRSRGIFTAHHEYSDDLGINDSAQEVIKGRLNGISILCVFTGRDENVPAVKKIYGHNNFVHINSPERFADMVGVMIQNELKNLL